MAGGDRGGYKVTGGYPSAGGGGGRGGGGGGGYGGFSGFQGFDALLGQMGDMIPAAFAESMRRKQLERSLMEDEALRAKKMFDMQAQDWRSNRMRPVVDASRAAGNRTAGSLW